MGKLGSEFKRYLKIIMFWFDVTMILLAYIGIVVLIAGKGLDYIIVILFVWLILYIVGKILYFLQEFK